jgi:hypothetical protein
MISAACHEELDGVLAWEWCIDPDLCMANESRAERGRAIANGMAAIRNDLAKLNNTVEQFANKTALAVLEQKLERIQSDLALVTKKPRVWKRIWKERNFAVGIFGSVVVIVLAILGGSGWVFDLYLDHALTIHLQPLRDDIAHIDKRVTRIEAAAKIQSASAVVKDLKNAPVADIQKHRDQIQNAKQTLAHAADKTLPDYWPTTAGILRLASVSASSPTINLGLEPTNSAKNVFGLTLPPGRWILSGTISHCMFKNSVIVFDPSVKLQEVIFINCIFLLPENIESPAPSIRNIGEKLLQAANIMNVKLSG